MIVDGAGPPVVMVHGYPDTHRLWDATVGALKDRYRCIRFTLPGFDLSREGRAYSLDEVIETIRRVVVEAAPGEKVNLLAHDWGCVFGYQFAMRHPQLVDRVMGIDIGGDAGSRQHRKELGAKGFLQIFAYQMWLAIAWRIGGKLGTTMSRRMARTMRCPTDPQGIGVQMNYPYALRWLGVAGGLKGVKTFEPVGPMLYIYGERKPFLFHSRDWIERLAARPGSRVIAMPTGHWIMVQRPREFNDAVGAWLDETGK